MRAALARFRRNPSRASADRVARHLLFDATSVRPVGHRHTAIEDYLIERARQPGGGTQSAPCPAIDADDCDRFRARGVAIADATTDSTPLGHTHR